MTALRAWFDSRSLREKRLLLAMLALTVLVVLWAGVVLPVTDGLVSARQRHGDAVIRLAETKARVDAVDALGRSRAPSLAGGLDAAVRDSADRAGFAPQTLNLLGPDRVQVGIASAKAGALIGWVASLEQSGLLVESLQLTDNHDGNVAATLTLRARRS